MSTTAAQSTAPAPPGPTAQPEQSQTSAAAPEKPAAAPPKASSKAKWIAAAVIAYLLVATVGVLFAAGAIGQLMHRERPHDLTLTTAFEQYTAAGLSEDPKAIKKARIALIIPAFLLYFIGPVGVLSMSGEKRELYGAARFATDREVEKSKLLGTKGLVLGKYKGKYLMMDGDLSVVVSAPPGSGKGAGIVCPNLLSWPCSVVALDVKPELFRITAGYRAAHGQPVYCWSPFNKEGCTHGYNPLAYIRTEFRYVVADILNIAQIIYQEKAGDSTTSNFFLGNARNLFLGLALYLIETPELPRTIGEILRLSSGKGKPVNEFLVSLIEDRKKANRPLSQRCEDALRRTLSAGGGTADGQTLGSIITTFNEPLTLFTDALVDAATSTNDFDLRQLRRQLMSVYVEIPVNRIAESRVLLNLFYSQLLRLNTAEDHENDPTIKHHLLLMDDEFAVMGYVAAFANSVGYLRSFWIRLVTILQSPAQLEHLYGKEVARTFRTCHGATVVMTPKDQQDAEEVSNYLGHLTAKSESKGRSSGRGGASSSSNVNPSKRPLMWPQELREMPADKEIVLVDGNRPIWADKIRYWEDPVFAERLLPPPELPRIDLDLYQARVEGRVRKALPDEAFSVERIVADFKALPAVPSDAGEAQLHAFVAAFLDQFSQGKAAPDKDSAAESDADHPSSEEPTPPDAAPPGGGPKPRRGRTLRRQPGGLSLVKG